MSSEEPRAMSDENEKKSALAPRLRFPEFRGAGEWEEKNLADICLRITNGKANAEDHEDDGIYPLYDRSETVKRSSEYAFDDEAVIIPGEGMRFQPKYHKGKFNLHQRAYALMQHQGNARFVYYTLDRFKDTLAKNAVKSTVLSLRLPIIEQFSLAVPDQKEQQKIADCLSSLDELIAAEAQKLDALKTHKKGLMQQLFPAEGETAPRLRFPEFREAGEWEEHEIGALSVKVGSGITPLGGDKNYKTEGRPFIRSQNVGWGELLLEDVAFIDEEIHNNFDATEIKDSDVLLNITGASIGRSAVADSRIVGGNVNQHVCIIRVVFDKLNPVFLNQFLISEQGQKQIDSFQAGGNRQGLNFVQIRSLKIPLPSIEAEQQKIADCLCAIDDLIAAQAQKIEKLKRHKKGLMKQLFPSIMEAI